MHMMHGTNLWTGGKLRETIHFLAVGKGRIYGSPLDEGVLRDTIAKKKPHVLLEVGVFRGATSTRMAKILDETPGCEGSFVISMDTWLLDLRFQWNGALSHNGQFVAKDK